MSMERPHDETVEVYENRVPETEATKTHDFPFKAADSGSALIGEISVEYKPTEYVLEEEALEAFIDAFDDPEMAPEYLVAKVYRDIVDAVFPGHAGYDDPWNKVPLVVRFEYRFSKDAAGHSVTLGQYR